MAILPFTPVGLAEVRVPPRNARWMLLLLAVGFGLYVWTTIDEASTIYGFWSRGVERTAHVNRLDKRSSGKVATWSYEIDIDGRTLVSKFMVPLEVGRTYAVLEVPGRSDVIVASKNSSLYDIYVATRGDTFMRLLEGATPLLVLLMLPFALLYRKRNRREATF